MSSALELGLGDMASVPLSGVCEVTQIQETELLGQVQRLYVLEVPHRNYVLKVPEAGLAKSGLRPLMEVDAMEQLLEEPIEVEVAVEEDEHILLREWTEQLREGEPGVRYRILTQMWALKKKKGKLGKNLRKLMKTVRENLRDEIEHVLELSPSSAGRKINLLLAESASKAILV